MALITLNFHDVVSVTEQVTGHDCFHTTKFLIKTGDNEIEIILFHKEAEIPHTKLPFKDTTSPLQSEST